MRAVKAKKYLGQHFLKDESIAESIVNALPKVVCNVLEIGPGMGVLTKYLMQTPEISLKAVEIDLESVNYLKTLYQGLTVISGDFLTMNLESLWNDKFAVIGNFPYHISSQILFRVLQHRDRIPIVVGMFQKEVAERVSANPNSKAYGILSVLLQAFYDVEYLFTVDEHVFSPPPKVKSAVIRIHRNSRLKLECDEKLFVEIVKTAFNQRRKTLRNALSAMFDKSLLSDSIFNKRAEQLTVQDFESIAHLVTENKPS